MHLTDLKEEEIEMAIKVGISKNNYYHSQLKFIIYILMGHIRLAMRSVILGHFVHSEPSGLSAEVFVVFRRQ